MTTPAPRAGLRRRVRARGAITPHRREAPSLPAGPGPEARARVRTPNVRRRQPETLGRRAPSTRRRADPRRHRTPSTRRQPETPSTRATQRRPLTAANEPEEFFASDFESMAPEEKLKDPLVLLGLGSIFLPFIMILGFQASASASSGIFQRRRVVSMAWRDAIDAVWRFRDDAVFTQDGRDLG